MSDTFAEAARSRLHPADGFTDDDRMGFEFGARWFSSELLSDAVVEAAAKRIYCGRKKWADLHPGTQDGWKDQAREFLTAAINAVQSPENGDRDTP